METNFISSISLFNNYSSPCLLKKKNLTKIIFNAFNFAQITSKQKMYFHFGLVRLFVKKFHFNISDFLLHKACFFGQRQHLSVCRCGTSFICSGIHPKHSPLSVEMSVEIISLHLRCSQPLAWNWPRPPGREGKAKNRSKIFCS